MSSKSEDNEDFGQTETRPFHFESRCPYILSMLAICAPLLMISTLCLVLSVLYAVEEVRMIHTDSQGEQRPYCTHSYYIHLINGLCSRGQIFSINIQDSCILWSDDAKWLAKDAENRFRYNLYESHAQFFATQNKTYAITNLGNEAGTTWPLLSKLAIVAIVMSIFNVVLCIGALDTDFVHNKLDIADVDYFVLATSFILTALTLAFDAYFVFWSYFGSEMTANYSWTTKECDFIVTPSIGFWVLCIGSVFGAIALFGILYSLIYLYILVDYYGYGSDSKKDADAKKPSPDSSHADQNQHKELKFEEFEENSVNKQEQLGLAASKGSRSQTKVFPAPLEPSHISAAGDTNGMREKQLITSVSITSSKVEHESRKHQELTDEDIRPAKTTVDT